MQRRSFIKNSITTSVGLMLLPDLPYNVFAKGSLPVGYYEVAGRAVVEGNTLTLTKIPVGSKYPVKVTIVAWQWGKKYSVKGKNR